MRTASLVFCGLLWLLPSLSAQNLSGHDPAPIDSDLDGLSDKLEQTLLTQFAPTFFVGAHDCSNIPAEFAAGKTTPTAEHQNGTIYGQAFPSKSSTSEIPVVELHYYHLWRLDCGEHSHPLDTEHVAVLVKGSSADTSTARWQATYWYAAAHENTVCDVSQIARAATLGAVDHGAKVWISPGKHASYLNETLCRRGCGADRCESMVPLAVRAIVNLGEPDHPMNGSSFISSSAWPLGDKMKTSNFPAEAIARLNGLPATDIAWFNAGKHPAQGIISISATTEGAIAHGGADTSAAINLAEDSSGNGLAKGYHKTKHALGISAHAVGKALHVKPDPDTKPQP